MKFRFIAALLGLAASLVLATASQAQSTAEVRNALAKVLPNFPASAKVVKTPYAGLYEVDIGDRVFYTDASGRYLFAGEILDTKTGTNMTKERIAELQKISWKDLPFKDSFKVVYGNGKRQIAVFEDPYCPYCHQLDKTLEKMSNMTVHVFLFPVIRPESPAKSREVWCAPDRSKAWQAWMNDQKDPPKAPAGCVDPLKTNLALGQRLGIESTPTMFLENGQRITGAVDAAEIEKRMAMK
ncbi:putative thiol:disulfide interchange protein DsbC precursor [mine drainage metagenome]|uniref:Putative thiol:disulfide interchange protein DsbC n=1 Tax=mine drainage metagenome TaxID=410659 RepID=A0A1J5QHG6_9ZZZZ